MSIHQLFDWFSSIFNNKSAHSPAAKKALRPTTPPVPSQTRPAFDPKATIDELIGIGKNNRFDAVIDDKEFEDIQIICKRGDEEIPLSKPSRAFYFGDHLLYDQEARRFDQEEKTRILNTDLFINNLNVFEELRRACQRGFVIPFVGAGMSKSAGLPDWKEYLIGLCNEAGLDQNAISERLEKQADYEGVMNDIVERLTLNVFERDFERSFHIPDEIKGSVTLLPKIFDSSVITTNFDRVLEKVYERDEKSFIGVVTGCGHSNAFFRAIPAGDRYLLKLHGNVDNAAERVLNHAEYNQAYGAEGNVTITSPIPRILDRLYSSYSFLFLGCSLAADRTIQTFMRVVADKVRDNLPRHYAILPCPYDGEQKRNVNQRLADANITPLWYPSGEHEHVEQILQLLLY